MSAEWKIVGQVGTVRRNGNYWLVNVADNQYWNGEKEFEVWFHLISSFKPRVKKGDRVIACGVFKPSSNQKFQYAMVVDNIGVIENDKEGDVNAVDLCVEDRDPLTRTTYCTVESPLTSKDTCVHLPHETSSDSHGLTTHCALQNSVIGKGQCIHLQHETSEQFTERCKSHISKKDGER